MRRTALFTGSLALLLASCGGDDVDTTAQSEAPTETNNESSTTTIDEEYAELSCSLANAMATSEAHTGTFPEDRVGTLITFLRDVGSTELDQHPDDLGSLNPAGQEATFDRVAEWCRDEGYEVFGG